MPIGSRKSRGGDEYVFIDGKAMRADEAVRIQLTAEDTAVPGQEEVSSVPGAAEAAGGKKKAKRSWSAQRAFEELDSGGAFDINEDFDISMQEVINLRADDKRKMRGRIGALLVALVAVFFASLCIGGNNEVGIVRDPITVAKALGTCVYLNVGSLLNLDYYDALAPFRAAQEIDGYASIVNRFATTVGTLVCGFLLSLAGMMYQNVFKNPLASPTMLGVSVGVRFGTIILVIMFGEAALTMESTRYVFCYIGGIIILGGVLLFSKAMSGIHGKINVADMLIAGSVFSTLLSSVSQFFLSYVLTDDEYEVFYELTTGMRATFEWYAFILLAIVVVIAVVPVFMTRFRLNTIAFDDSEARLLGVNPQTLRVFVLVAGTIMILAAQIHVGVISLVSLVVPFIVRYIVGSEFGKQLIGNMLLGPLMLIICQDVCGLVPFMGGHVSLTAVVGFVGLPLYIWMTALGKKGWN